VCVLRVIFFLENWEPPAGDDKILTFQRLRRYNITRIQHDLLKVQHALRAEDGGTEEDRLKLTSLLRDHGKNSLLLLECIII
jgi:hypothetical protein